MTALIEERNPAPSFGPRSLCAISVSLSVSHFIVQILHKLRSCCSCPVHFCSSDDVAELFDSGSKQSNAKEVLEGQSKQAQEGREIYNRDRRLEQGNDEQEQLMEEAFALIRWSHDRTNSRDQAKIESKKDNEMNVLLLEVLLEVLSCEFELHIAFLHRFMVWEQGTGSTLAVLASLGTVRHP